MAEQIKASSVAEQIRLFFQDRFNLHEDQATEKETIEEIKKNVIFRGANLWILIFAIMIASVGLNVNSPAVVIGAMLISPLMGPIMGIGLGMGINDFELIVKALRNLAIAVAISVITSALYFWISPLNDAQSELLARTTPTLWDVLIALFGGLAGIVAGSRKEKSNAIPGVAIATALMPPLCTAGYGLATAQWSYFFGAFYLFFINSVFISFSTYLIVRVLRYRPKEFVDRERETRIKRYIAIFMLLTIIPSVYTAYNVVRKSFVERSINNFIDKELRFEGTQVISKKIIEKEDGSNKLTVTLFGKPVDDSDIERSKQSLVDYNLSDLQLEIHQGYQRKDSTAVNMEVLNQKMRAGIIQDLYERNEEVLKSKEERIKILEEEVVKLKSKELPIKQIAKEMKAINPNIEAVSINESILSVMKDSMTTDTVFLAYIDFKKASKRSERTQLIQWLKARINSDNIKMITE